MRYPSDAALSLDGARTLARAARKLTELVGKDAGRVRDRSRALGRRLRAISRTLGRRTGERKAQVLALTDQAGQLLTRSIREARRLVLTARRRARGRGAQRKLAAISRLEQAAGLAERVTTQIKLRIERQADHRPAGVDVRPGCSPDPQGQARQAERVWLCASDLRGDSKHPARSARFRSCRRPPRRATRRRTSSCPTQQRARAARAAPAGGRARWRLREGPNRPRARGASRPRGCSSLAANNPAPDEHKGGSPDTAPEQRAGSATSSAATDCAAPA